MPDIFNIGVSGLNAANVALATVSHNISNANTTGYTRQTVQQSALVPQDLGSNFIGMGVSVDSVTRQYNKYLNDQTLSAQSTSSYYSAQLTQLNQIDNIMASTTAGLSPSLQNYFTSLQTLSQNPASLPSRQNVLASAQALVSQFQSIDNRLSQIQQGTNTQIVSAVASINTLANTIASLNKQITALAPGGSVNQPNDLLDQRDQAMSDLNKLIGATYVQESNGSYDVFIGNGQTLVQGYTTLPLSTQQNATNPANVDITQPNPNGSVTVMPDYLFSGGSLGGLLNFRDNTLQQTQVTLGNIAIDFTTSMNYQSKLGLDLNGNAGTNMFTDLTGYASQPQNAIANLQMLMGDPRNIAAASDMQVSKANQSALNTAGVSVNSVAATLPGNYGWTSATAAGAPSAASHLSLTIGSTAATGMTVTASAAGVITATLGATTYNVVVDPTQQNGYKVQTGAGVDVGIAFTLSGKMPNSTSFTITQNNAASFGSGDNSNLRQIQNLQTKAVVDPLRNGTTTGLQSFQDAYASAASIVGNSTNTAKSAGDAAKTNLQQTTLAKSNFSGVNLDQEAADLIRYQQAYQASSKVISTAQKLFDQILSMG
ncbi:MULTISPECIES: flagellar hook-associated protein FlgK [unclassified Paludibacterium]|uniref:flagellar hook-associated protein FlgK n=1 Tax=unclassified Paludibacterium TaxID=2618429 RepID=UPI001C056D90|nr:flagellar hook-associated protein FlgK [Paludibacterium sp. B53371]BEV71506.1 flagellar hook-associated protein FlgK [Paludibacterium sp. THUN1379]